MMPRVLEIAQRFWCAPSLNLIYLRNPKAACSSIQEALWLAVDPGSYQGNPHNRKIGPARAGFKTFMSDPERIQAATIFTAVRNPYSRFVSAYLDKIHRNGSIRAWAVERFEFPIGPPPPFGEFIAALVADGDSVTFDQHFRPQTSLLLPALIQPNVVFYFERMEEVAAFLAARECNLGRWSPHGTDSTSVRLSPLEAESIRRLYAADFEAYGYCDDPSDLRPKISHAILSDHQHPELAAFLAAQRRPKHLPAARPVRSTSSPIGLRPAKDRRANPARTSGSRQSPL